MCFHGNQVSWGINHSFISLYSKYQPTSFICSPIMLAPVFSSLDEIYCIRVKYRRTCKYGKSSRMKKRMTLSTRAKASFQINSLGTVGDQTDLSLAIFKFPGVVAFATKNLALVNRGAKSFARDDDLINNIIPPGV